MRVYRRTKTKKNRRRKKRKQHERSVTTKKMGNSLVFSCSWKRTWLKRFASQLIGRSSVGQDANPLLCQAASVCLCLLSRSLSGDVITVRRDNISRYLPLRAVSIIAYRITTPCFFPLAHKVETNKEHRAKHHVWIDLAYTPTGPHFSLLTSHSCIQELHTVRVPARNPFVTLSETLTLTLNPWKKSFILQVLTNER